MKLSQLLYLIQETADKKNISQPFICGGIPRDKLLGRLQAINDLDITTGDDTVHDLAKELALTFKGKNSNFKIMSDGHAQLMIGNFKVDFSSNFQSPNINNILKKIGISNPTNMQKEIYSRDFTCNSLLLSLDLKIISDPLGLGVNDINKRILKPCLSPEITFINSPKRIPRIIYLASKLNFDVDPKIIEWVKNHASLINNVNKKYLTTKIISGFNYNPQKTIKLLDDMNLWPYLPIIEELVPHMSKKISRI